jgi:hypothetical protein
VGSFLVVSVLMTRPYGGASLFSFSCESLAESNSLDQDCSTGTPCARFDLYPSRGCFYSISPLLFLLPPPPSPSLSPPDPSSPERRRRQQQCPRLLPRLPARPPLDVTSERGWGPRLRPWLCRRPLKCVFVPKEPYHTSKRALTYKQKIPIPVKEACCNLEEDPLAVAYLRYASVSKET